MNENMIAELSKGMPNPAYFRSAISSLSGDSPFHKAELIFLCRSCYGNPTVSPDEMVGRISEFFEVVIFGRAYRPTQDEIDEIESDRKRFKSAATIDGELDRESEQLEKWFGEFYDLNKEAFALSKEAFQPKN